MLLLVSGVVFFGLIFGRWKRDPYIRFSKFSVVMLIASLAFFMGLHAPHVWGSQFVRNLNKGMLIEPYHEDVETLEDYFYEWLGTDLTGPTINNYWILNYTNDGLMRLQREDARYIYFSGQLSREKFTALDSVDQLIVLDYFVNEIIMEWTSDSTVYGSMEHKATVSEALARGLASSWAEKSLDDCDGISVVTVSLLQRMGFKAYIGSGKSHWFTVVEPRATDGFIQPLFLNYWSSVHCWYYFNQYEVKMAQPLIDSIKDIWFIDEMEPEVQAILNAISEQYIIFLSVSMIIALFGALFFTYPRESKEDIKSEIERQRNLRSEKINKNSFLANKKNPIHWVAKGTYVRVGNPINKLYSNYWLDVIWMTIALFFIVLGIFPMAMHPAFYIYIAFSLWAVIFVADRGYIVKLKDWVINRKTREEISKSD